jgi:hypothetical protein
MIRVECALQTVSEANRRDHWRTVRKRSREQQAVVSMLLRPELTRYCIESPRTRPCVVTLTRIASRRLDGDNLQGAFKAIRDSVARCLGVDDGEACVSWEYAQEFASKRCAIRVEIDARP